VVWRRESQIGSVEPKARIVRKAAAEVLIGLERPDLRELSLPAGLLVNEIGVPAVADQAVAPIGRILTKAASCPTLCAAISRGMRT
jgi:hypothetical protein